MYPCKDTEAACSDYTKPIRDNCYNSYTWVACFREREIGWRRVRLVGGGGDWLEEGEEFSDYRLYMLALRGRREVGRRSCDNSQLDP